VLRTQHDEPVWDVDDIAHLIAMADWECLCERAAKDPASLNAVVASNAAARHRQVTGHKLAMGCCAGRDLSDVWNATC